MSEIPKAFIKSVALPLNPRYKLTSSPFPSDDSTTGQSADFFIGRNQHRKKFLRFLRDDRRKGGVFLVTGFRGVGKTSFVNQTLKDYKESLCEKENACGDCKGCEKAKDRVIDIHLTLTQNNPKESDILRLIVASVFDAYKKHDLKYPGLRQFMQWVNRLLHLLVIPLIIFSVPLIAALLDKTRQVIFFDGSYHEVVIYCCLVVATGYVLVGIYTFSAGRADTAINRITSLFERCYNTLAVENNVNQEAAIPLLNIRLFSNGERRTRQYPVASNKEIEFELQCFLKLAQAEGLEFILIFDELDKVEPSLSGQDLYEDPEATEKGQNGNSAERNSRDRRQAIISIIAGLKNFFTTADARFIFIAGNEMFDATLADISDRQSSISSIFTYAFNIESLLKEKDLFEQGNTVNSLSMSDAIELYVKKLLFECSEEELQEQSVYQLASRYLTYASPNGDGEVGADLKKEYFAKVYFVLQHFITYLAYRSNGSPKKLIREIHEFIKIGDHMDPKQTIVGQRLGSDITEENEEEQSLYLYFNYYNQYRIGFINYLYWPFLIRFGRSLKLFSDNLIVSTPYLFDHLIKFHPFAFSLYNLEQVPEVLSTNKTPLLRLHLRKIIDYLGANHLKEIEIGLFDYKFRSRTLNEISYLSKVSEQEAAALNYTLDESYLVKLQVRNKIKDLRATYADFLKGQDQTTHIFSISHLNATLGDLYFFDQQYDDAIVAYSDAIRTINRIEISQMSMHDFIMLIRNRLKIGLCFEKISAYEDALAHYANCSTDASRFMLYRFAKEDYIKIMTPASENSAPDYYDLFEHDAAADKPTLSNNDEIASIDRAIYHSASLSDLLQLILQTFLAQLYIQEKKSVAGVSEIKIFIAFGSFMKITEGFIIHAHRNRIIKANAYLHVGHLFYFRNSERTPALNDQIAPILPEWVFKDLKILKDTYDNKLAGRFGRPVLGLYFYVLGLVETFRYRGDFPENKLPTDPKLRGLDCSNYVKLILKHPGNIVCSILEYLETYSARLSPVRGMHYHNMAVLLSNIGDDLLSRYRPARNTNERYHQISIEEIFVTTLPEKHLRRSTAEFRSYLRPSDASEFMLADVLACYHLSGFYYEKQGRFVDAVFQLCKILYVLRMVLAKPKRPAVARRFTKWLRECLIQPALTLVSQMSGHTDRHMLRKATGLEISPHIAINNLSNHPESREVILLFNYLLIKLGVPLRETDTTDPLKYLISPINSFATQHMRLLELATMARFLENRVLTDAKKYSSANADEKKTLEQGFMEYLYCRLSILQILDILGPDYWLGYGYLAYSHFHTAEFLKAINGLPKLNDELHNQLKEYLGKGSYSSKDYLYHYAKAKEYYEETIQLHTAGDAYRNLVGELIYLEDDFNDNVYHFGAALDRYMMNNKVFENRIKDCEKELMADVDFSALGYSD